MITATFENKETFNVVSDEVWQYDYGQVLQVNGLDLSGAIEVDFSINQKGDATAQVVVGAATGGTLLVSIPDEMFDVHKSQNYNVYAYIFETDSDSGETTHMITIPVMTRPSREEYSGSGEKNPFDDVLEEVNKALKEAQEAAATATNVATLISDSLEQIDANRAGIEALEQRMTVAEEEIVSLVNTVNQHTETINKMQTLLDSLGLSVVDGAINATYNGEV